MRRQTNPLIRRIARLSRRKDLAGLSLALGELVQPAREQANRLSRLQPPLRDEARFREVIRLEGREIDYIHSAYVLLGTYDRRVVVVLRRLDRTGKRENALLRSLGLSACL